MSKEIINPSSLPKPALHSNAVKKSGLPVFLAGQVAYNAAGDLVGANDPGAQCEQAFANVRKVVEACGGTMDDIVKVTIYVTDVNFRSAITEVRRRLFKEGEAPATTFLVVAALARPDLLVEVEAIAVIEPQ